MSLAEEKPTRTIDVKGQICPYPLIETRTQLKALAPIAGHRDRVPVPVQVKPDELGRLCVVFDNQHSRLHHHSGGHAMRLNYTRTTR